MFIKDLFFHHEQVYVHLTHDLWYQLAELAIGEKLTFGSPVLFFLRSWDLCWHHS
jgi:hypothetical protein